MRRDGNRHARKAELVRANGNLVTSSSPGSLVSPFEFTVPSWTSSAGRFYYDLSHNRARLLIFITLYSVTLGEYINTATLAPQSTAVLRIWLDSDPGANDIKVLYW